MLLGNESSHATGVIRCHRSLALKCIAPASEQRLCRILRSGEAAAAEEGPAAPAVPAAAHPRRPQGAFPSCCCPFIVLQKHS